MLKSKIGMVLALVLSISCSKNDDSPEAVAACGFENALEELPWLKAEIDRRESNPSEEMNYCYIEQVEINGLTLFVLGDCNPNIDKYTPWVNCEREEDFVIPEGDSIVRNRKIIWKPKNFACDSNGNLTTSEYSLFNLSINDKGSF